MANKIYLDVNDIKFVDGVQTIARSLDSIVKGDNSAHKTRHQDAGADEISLAGLSGEPADTVNKTGIQTIAGVKTFSDIPLLPANTVETEDIKDANVTGLKLHATLASGWVEANETWTYASATTFTITGDKTAKYQIGDKIKLTQTTVKYFNIITVSYTDPNTTVTITGGIDYTLADATITSPFYSKIENPQGFPHWFNWTPTYSADSSMTFTDVNTIIAKFIQIGKTIFFKVKAQGTTGGTAGLGLQCTLPINCADTDAGLIGGGCSARDAGTPISGHWYNIDNNIIIVSKYDSTNYGLGPLRYLRVQGFYRIA